jgi:hypothetical protein
MSKNSKYYLKYSLLLIIIAIIITAYLAYKGNYLGEESNPDGEYTLKYYSTFNPFKMQWSMPGGSSCKPRWVRLYNKAGDKLNELYTTDCAMEMDARWIGGEVILSDGNTMWTLPGSNSKK